MKQNRVTIKQAEKLKKLGFKEGTTHYSYNYCNKGFKVIEHSGQVANWNKFPLTVSIPTIDTACDWIRRKFNVIVYDATPPYVDPAGAKCIWYRYETKFCNTLGGWNFREYIGTSKRLKNAYAAKRQALSLALSYIVKSKAKIIKIKRK